jgi:dipeptidyl aminopeptidase/acylaminoacyl peptidase
VTAQTPPAFLWHTAEDSAVPAENSIRYALALSEYKIPYELHIYERGGHGLGLAFNDGHIHTWTQLCGQWLKMNGF